MSYSMPQVALYPTEDGDYVLAFKTEVSGDAWMIVAPQVVGMVIDPDTVSKFIHLTPVKQIDEDEIAKFRAQLGIDSDGDVR